MHEGGSLSNIVENFNAWYEVLDFAFVIRKWVQLNVKESALDLIKVTPAIEFEYVFLRRRKRLGQCLLWVMWAKGRG